MRARRLANWGPTHETPEGRPHLKPQVGEHLEQRLAAPPTGQKPQTECHVVQSQGGPARPRDSSPGRLDRPPKPPKHKAAGSAGCALLRHKAGLLPASQAQSPWIHQMHAFQAQSQLRASQAKSCWTGLINGLIACQGPHLQCLPNTCTQSPAGPTSSLGQRQNTQQRGATGLGETAG